MSKYDKLLSKFNISEEFTKPVRKPKKFDKVKENIPLVADQNFQMDLLFLPKTKQGFNYLLVCVDLANDQFDIEPIKNKKPETVLDAFKKMLKRQYLNLPGGSISTDAGSEFKGAFHKFIFDKNIYHKQTLPGRHTQQANVERLNRELGRFLNGYMNVKEEETGKRYNEWTDIVNALRKELNNIREKKLPKDQPHSATKADILQLEHEPEFNVGDLVYYQLDTPRDALNTDIKDYKFRAGDRRWSKDALPIEKVLVYPLGYRYLLKDRDNVSYSERQLKKAKETEATYRVQKITAKKTVKGVVQYKVRWKGYKAADDTWEPKKQLIEDGFEPEIKEFEAQQKAKKK